jgi:hypothetical protein
MKPEIETFITKNYYELLKIAKKYTKNDDWSSELLHEIIIQLYDQKEYKGNVDDKSLKYYIIRMLMVNWCYETSPFYRKYKRNINVDLDEAINIAAKENDTDIHELMDILEVEWAETNWFHKTIFEKYLVMGSLKKVSKDTTIPLMSISRYVNETKTQIKLNTFKKLKDG